MSGPEQTRRGGRRGNQDRGGNGPLGHAAYVNLKNPFTPQQGFSDDQIAAMHDTALRVLEELGIRVLLDEGRSIFRAGGALVDESTQMVRIGRDMVQAALASAPRSIRLRAANPAREQDFAAGSTLFMAGAGCPNVFDATRGRRPGSKRDYIETLRLQQSFDVIHMHGPSAEPQDVAVNLRHYTLMEEQLSNCDKPLFVYARGRGQVDEAFQMIRLAYGLDEDSFANNVWVD